MVKQVLPQHVAEIRMNHSETYDIFEYSSISRFNFNNGIVKKIDKYMESKKDQLIIGYDFFKKLCEANTKDLSLPPLSIATTDQLITHTKIIQLCKPRSEMATKNSEGDSDIGDEPPNEEMDDSEGDKDIEDNPSDSEVDDSSYDSSDEDSSDDEIDELELQQLKDYQQLSCPKCGRIVSYQYHLKCHLGSKACKEANCNTTVEARAIRTLRKKIDNNSICILTKQSDISHISPITENSNLDYASKYFISGWAKRPGHGKTKGHTYMTSTHKEMIQKYFYEGEDDKGMKKSAALMVEAMTK